MALTFFKGCDGTSAHQSKGPCNLWLSMSMDPSKLLPPLLSPMSEPLCTMRTTQLFFSLQIIGEWLCLMFGHWIFSSRLGVFFSNLYYREISSNCINCSLSVYHIAANNIQIYVSGYKKTHNCKWTTYVCLLG